MAYDELLKEFEEAKKNLVYELKVLFDKIFRR